MHLCVYVSASCVRVCVCVCVCVRVYVCVCDQPEEHGQRALLWIMHFIDILLVNYIEVSLETDMFADLDAKIAAYWCVGRACAFRLSLTAPVVCVCLCANVCVCMSVSGGRGG
ncbi:MAG: hypothetical protein P4L40_03930 [Terracidiphilus sp.]|nr:hypothetical protein [Terracidiphilus sp.]